MRRNAYFNIAKLGARPFEYVENFYGRMADSINEGDESDRLVVEWLLKEEVVARRPDEGVAALVEVGGRPVREPARAARRAGRHARGHRDAAEGGSRGGQGVEARDARGAGRF
ncbi:hypothetical protein GCM10020219_072970 [Nonomuraea dietziae]